MMANQAQTKYAIKDADANAWAEPRRRTDLSQSAGPAPSTSTPLRRAAPRPGRSGCSASLTPPPDIVRIEAFEAGARGARTV